MLRRPEGELGKAVVVFIEGSGVPCASGEQHEGSHGGKVKPSSPNP
jgi:hypothetical protein